MMNVIKRSILHLIPESVLLSQKLKRELDCGEAVLVHQMGKVGSASVLRTLESHLHIPVYQTHHLSDEGIKIATAFHRRHEGRIPYNIRLSTELQKQLGRLNNLKIITLVRDPIAREISGYFQLGSRIFEEIGKQHTDPDVRREKVLLEVHRQIMHLKNPRHFPNVWFDREMKGLFGIDVYSCEFDCEKGYTQIHRSGIDVLLIRTENLDRVWSCAINEFFEGNLEWPLQRHNMSFNKKEADAWRYVRDNLQLAVEDCEAIYSTRLAKHFYTDMTNELIKKWTHTL